MCLRVVVLCLFLAACGDDGGANQLPDAPVTGELVLDGPGHDYGDVTVLVPSAPFTLTVTNPTSIAVGPLSVTLTGDESFAIAASTCRDATLDPGLSCTTEIVFTPTSPGEKTATLTIRSGDAMVSASLVGTGTVSVPTAVADAVTLLEDAGETTIDVRANDLNAQKVTVDAVTQGTLGVVAVGKGNVTYTPNADANGSDTFTYTLSGGSVGTVTVTLTPVNDPPTFVGGPDVTVGEDTGAHTIAGWATQISTGPANEASQTIVSTQTSNDNTALFTVQPALDVTGTLTFTVAPGMIGTATVQTTIVDSEGGTAQIAAFLLTVADVDQPPVAVDDTFTVEQDGGAQALDVLANDTDSDGGPIAVASATQPAAGTGSVTVTASGVDYTPPAGYCNSVSGVPATFSYTLTPGNDTATVSVTVACKDTRLASLTVTNGAMSLALSPAFAATTTSYTLPAVGLGGGALNITATTVDPLATVSIQASTPATTPVTRTANVLMGANSITVVVRRSGLADRTYTLAIARSTSAAHQAYIKATNPGPNVEDFFGTGVAIDGDTMVVGASQEDGLSETIFNGGAAYVYVRSGTTWSLQQVLRASNPQTNDLFGARVAIDGDTIAVGAPYEASNATTINGDQSNNSSYGQGAIYVFTRSGSTWTQQAYLKAANGGSEDFLGNALALSGDTLVAGVPYEDASSASVPADNSVSRAGAAYVFQRTGTTWAQTAYLKAAATNVDDFFGYSVGIDGNSIVVGVPYEDSGSMDPTDNSAGFAGAAYVFVRSGSTWLQQAYLKSPSFLPNSQVGYTVAISGSTIALSAPSDSSSVTEGDGLVGSAGAVHVFTRSGTTWSREAFLQAAQKTVSDRFGDTLAIDGNAIVVGMRDEDGGNPGINPTVNETRASSGAAIAFYRTGTRWDRHAYIKAVNPDASDWFGYAIDIDDNTCVVSAVGESSNGTGPNDNSVTYSGAVYVITGMRP